MNYIKEAENRLWYYRDLQGSTIEMQRQINRIVGRSGPQALTAIHLDDTGVKSGRHDETINTLFEIQRLQAAIERTQEEFGEINQLLDGISQEQGCELYGMVLQKWYIERQTKEAIARDINYSSIQTVYDIKNKAIRKFAVRLFGIEALAAI